MKYLNFDFGKNGLGNPLWIITLFGIEFRLIITNLKNEEKKIKDLQRPHPTLI